MSTEAPIDFDRNALLDRTPEQIAEDQLVQDAARERLEHFVSDSVAVAQYRNAVGAEAGIRESIDNISLRISESGDDDPESTSSSLVILANQLAESLYWQGKFSEAAMVAVSIDQKREYEAANLAFITLDAPLCTCAPIITAQPGSAKGVETSSRREVQRVFIGTLQREVKFILCSRCKFLFAQSL